MTKERRRPFIDDDLDDIEMVAEESDDLRGVVLTLDGYGESAETKAALRAYLLAAKRGKPIRGFSVIEFAQKLGIEVE